MDVASLKIWLSEPLHLVLCLLALWGAKNLLFSPKMYIHVEPAPPVQKPGPLERLVEIKQAWDSLYDVFEKVWEARDFWVRLVGYRFVVRSSHSRYRLYRKAALKLIGEENLRTVREEDVFTKDEWGDHELSHTELSGVVRSRWVRFEGSWLYISRSSSEEKGQGKRRASVEELAFHFVTRDRTMIERFRRFAEGVAASGEEKMLTIYHPRWSSWTPAVRRRLRPTESLFFNGDVHLDILEDFRRFKARKEVYYERGRLHKRGYLFRGAPGGGKTNLALWFAGQLGMDIAVLSTRGIDDDDLTYLTLNMPPNTILLLEDVDTVAPKSRRPSSDEDDEGDDNIDSNEDEGKDRAENEDGEDGEDEDKDEREDKDNGDNKSNLSLGALLNTLDGLLSRDGQVVVMTTNHAERLDPALIRPGRADVVKTIESPNAETTRKMAVSWYGEKEDLGLLVEALQKLSPVPSAAELEAHFDRCVDAGEAARRVGEIVLARMH